MTLQIRSTESTDAAALKELYKSESVFRNTLQLPYPNLARWETRLTKIPDNVYSYVAVIEDEVVGNLGFIVSTRDRQRHIASLGMSVKADFHGQGVGSALLAAAIDLADNWLNLHRIELTVFTDNAPAIALYKKFGFVIEGEATDFAFRDGEYVNAYYMARIKNAQRLFTRDKFSDFMIIEKWNVHQSGILICATCQNELFSTEARYDKRQTVFCKPISANSIVEIKENPELNNYENGKVLCQSCESLLGAYWVREWGIAGVMSFYRVSPNLLWLKQKDDE